MPVVLPKGLVCVFSASDLAGVLGEQILRLPKVTPAPEATTDEFKSRF